MMRVWNEREWLKASIESVRDHVDEIVAVDNGSTDGSLQELERLAEKTGKLRVFSFPGRDICELSNFALGKTRFNWVLKWDADFVAAEGVGAGLAPLAAHLRGLDRRRYHYVSPGLIELAGDFRHQFPKLRVRHDMEVFTYSDGARYVPVKREAKLAPYPFSLPARDKAGIFKVIMEGLRLPVYYRIDSFSEAVAYHVNVKPAIRHMLGYFYVQWLGACGAGEALSLEDYALREARGGWGVNTLEEAAAFFMREYARNLSPYDPALGPLPGNIEALAAASRFNVTYSGGRPYDRTEVSLPGGLVQ